MATVAIFLLRLSAHRLKPPASPVLLVITRIQHRTGTVDQQRSQVAVAPFADVTHFCFSAARMLPGHQSQPGCHLPPALKLFCITHCGDQGAGGYRTNPADLLKSSDTLIFLRQLFKPAVITIQSLIKCLKFFC